MVVAGQVKGDGDGKQGKRRINNDIGADASKSYRRAHLPRGMEI